MLAVILWKDILSAGVGAGSLLFVLLFIFAFMPGIHELWVDALEDKRFEKDKKRFARELAGGNPNPRVPIKISFDGRKSVDMNSLVQTKRFKEHTEAMNTAFILSKKGAVTIHEWGVEPHEEKIKEFIKRGEVEIREGRVVLVKKAKDPS